MSQALYRKYRSRGWDELVGQQHVVATLQNAIKNGSFSHAYLFSGPRGVGKTSVARILARQINDLDYASDGPHIDIIEIDAASNTSVDDVRDLREKASVAPALAKYKVYIIDEVHMLSKSAFNALLKTLEEPPEHVVFILATTDPQKLPDTIISRTQHFTFSPFGNELIASQLKAVAASEKIDLDDSAAELIAELADGGMRDALSLLDQLAASGEKIDTTLVERLAGLPPKQLIRDIHNAIDSHNPKKVIELLASSRISGYQAGSIAAGLSQLIREEAVEGKSQKLSLARSLLEVPASLKPEQLLEILLIEASLTGATPVDIAPETPRQKPPEPSPTVSSSNPGPKSSAEPKPKKKEEPQPAHKEQGADELWTKVLDSLRGNHNTLYGVARMAKPALADGVLTLSFAYPFHLKRLNESKNRKIISDIISQHDKGVKLALEHAPELAESAEPQTPRKTDQTGALKSISDVFGGGELLESD